MYFQAKLVKQKYKMTKSKEEKAIEIMLDKLITEIAGESTLTSSR